MLSLLPLGRASGTSSVLRRPGAAFITFERRLGFEYTELRDADKVLLVNLASEPTRRARVSHALGREGGSWRALLLGSQPSRVVLVRGKLVGRLARGQGMAAGLLTGVINYVSSS